MKKTIGYGVLLLAGVVGVGIVALLVGGTLDGEAPAWVLGRALGLASYTLLLALVSAGLFLAHPWARHLRWPAATSRLHLHVMLAVFTGVFTAGHVVVLATDPWAGVGWLGAVLPMASQYRPIPVTLGVVALWAGLITGVTARLAGRFAGRLWWPIHKVAIVLFGLVWAHAVLTGADVVALRGFYLATGAAVIALAITRYAARTAPEQVKALTKRMSTVVSSTSSTSSARDKAAPPRATATSHRQTTDLRTR